VRVWVVEEKKRPTDWLIRRRLRKAQSSRPSMSVSPRPSAFAFVIVGALVLTEVAGARPQVQPLRLASPPVRVVPYRYLGVVPESASMEPTLHCARSRGGVCGAKVADLVLVALSGGKGIHRGDIVLFRLPPAAEPYCRLGGVVLKRVIGVGGDRIREQSGRVIVNGRLLAEPYVPARERDNRSGSWATPRGSLFVLGDNRVNSCDSRYWGPLSLSRVLGRAAEVLRSSPSGKDPVGPPIIHTRYPNISAADPGGAMEPTIRCSRAANPKDCSARVADKVLIELSGARLVHRGTIISFRLPPAAERYCNANKPGEAIERVIGLSGDRIVEHRGFFAVNGRALIEPYVARGARDKFSGSWRVPSGSFFVMADYRAGSCDSRLWGALKATYVVGDVSQVIRQIPQA
jgi:signal peptidase I